MPDPGQRLTLLARMTRSVVAAVPLEEQMNALAAQVCVAFGVDACVIRGLEDDNLILRGSEGVPAHHLLPSLPLSRGLAGKLLADLAPLAIPDINSHPLTAHLNSRPSTWKFLSYAGAPILLSETATGIIGIYSTSKKREFTETDLEHLQIVANHAAVAQENHRLFQSLQEEKAERERMLMEALDRAERDPLTGLLNHNAFYLRLNHEATAARSEGRSLAVVFVDLDNFKFFNESYGHAAGNRVLQRVAETLKAFCGPNDYVARLGGDEFALLLRDADSPERESLARRLENQVLRIGYRPPGYAVDVPLRLSAGVAFFPDDASAISDVAHRADERLLGSKRNDDSGASTSFRVQWGRRYPDFAMLDALVGAVDSKDRYTRHHCEDVAHYAAVIAEGLELSQKEQEDVRAAALILDIGKIGVPDRLLRLPAPLEQDELEQVRRHAPLGALLVGAAGLPDLVPLVRHHHEAWDGTGYPDGLAGEEIPKLARILAVADAFSAMISDRPYRRAFPIAAALEELQAGMGRLWDAACVRSLLNHHRRTDELPLTNSSTVTESK